MSWLTRYRIRRYIASSVWVVPMTYFLAAVVLTPITRMLDSRVHWKVFDTGPTGATAVITSLVSSTLSFLVFVFTILLLVFQFSSAQLSPRILTLALNDRFIKHVLGVFAASFAFSIGVLGRVETHPPQLRVAMVVVLNALCVVMFLLLLDHVGKALRPVTLVARVAEAGKRLIPEVYPDPLGPNGDAPSVQRRNLGDPIQVVEHVGPSGVVEAFNARKLIEVAVREQCVIELVPQVGDFITTGEPLLRAYDTSKKLNPTELRELVATGTERTIRQDPGFPFRILVDIAIKALSPAINDPTTAVTAIDQIHRLLRMVGMRHLEAGLVSDSAGNLRLVYRTPNWEDFVWLATAEIRQFGASSVQITRRLRAMLDSLIRTLPPSRSPALGMQIELLSAQVDRTFLDPRDRALALEPDQQGIGGSA
jgi:uncharacterized membrane protein